MKIAPFFCNVSVVIIGLFIIYKYQQKALLNVVEFLYLNLYQTVYKTEVSVKFSIKFMFFLQSYRKYILKTIECVQFNFYFNEVYNYLVSTQFIYYFTFVFFNLDKGGFELFGPTGFARLYKK